MNILVSVFSVNIDKGESQFIQHYINNLVFLFCFYRYLLAQR